ncbi:sigma-70 family RNA polymerase sigma factor [Candidatus Micrarchaeota archaeon]|nr:sigma-70 family RNA polymerase sigma factor [Candidatus Micrarchaeota archaeon]
MGPETLANAIPLRLSEKEGMLTRTLEYKADMRIPLTRAEAEFAKDAYRKFLDWSAEIRDILEEGGAGGAEDLLAEESAAVREIRARLAVLMFRAVPVSLTYGEAAAIHFVERFKKKRNLKLSEEEESVLIKAFIRFTERAEVIRDVLACGKQNGKEPEAKKELERVEATRRKISGLVICANQRFVASIAKRYQHHPGMEFRDLMSEGSAGLLKALERFDYRKGNRFSTYSSFWIRHSISRAIADKARSVRVPVRTLESLQTIRRYVKSHQVQFGRSPTVLEISKAIGMPQRAVKSALEANSKMCQLTDPLSRRLSAPDAKGADAMLGQMQLERQIPGLLEILNPFEREILERRFGLSGRKEETLQEIEDSMCFCRERIRQIEIKALAKLQGAALMQGLEF